MLPLDGLKPGQDPRAFALCKCLNHLFGKLRDEFIKLRTHLLASVDEQLIDKISVTKKQCDTLMSQIQSITKAREVVESIMAADQTTYPFTPVTVGGIQGHDPHEIFAYEHLTTVISTLKARSDQATGTMVQLAESTLCNEQLQSELSLSAKLVDQMISLTDAREVVQGMLRPS
jgi:hypothetical protein